MPGLFGTFIKTAKISITKAIRRTVVDREPRPPYLNSAMVKCYTTPKAENYTMAD